jgi:hypothetical protein
MNGENLEHWMLTQLLPNLEEPSVITTDKTPYHSVLLEKSPTQTLIKDEIIAWLQENRISFTERSFEAKLLNLATANTFSKIGKTISLILASPLNKLLLVYNLGLSSASFSTMP